MGRLVTLRSRPGTVTGTIEDDVAANTTALVVQLFSSQPGLRPSSLAAEIYARIPAAGAAASARVVVAQLSRALTPDDGQGLFNWLGPGSTAIGNLADQAAAFGIPCEELLFGGFPCQNKNVAGAAGTNQFLASPTQFRWRYGEAPVVAEGKWLAAILAPMEVNAAGSQIQGMLTFNVHRNDGAGREFLEQRP